MPRTISLPATLDERDFRLLNDWQRDFPLQTRPFERIGRALGIDEAESIERYRRLCADGLVSRLGAVFAPRRLGASALAALAAPSERLEEIARRVSSENGINHNYQREHHFNLWFVITAPSDDALQAIVSGIERDTGCSVIVLPLEEEFHIDLGFDLGGSTERRRSHYVRHGEGPSRGSGTAGDSAVSGALDDHGRELIRELQSGLPLVVKPYAELAARVGGTETDVIERIRGWIDDGLIRRFGVIVRHHELGIEANAMCVWDVADDQVSALGKRLAAEPAVTLCYRRQRALPDWPYNLFCMIHGSRREEVLAAHAELSRRHGLDGLPGAVLFSCRRFKQTGARYLSTEGSHV